MLAYIKPKVILLDDDQSLLEVIHYYFTEQFQDKATVKTFSNSEDFLSYLEDHCYLPDAPSEIIRSFYKSDRSNSTITKALKDLTELCAIIVLDQELRGENVTGIDIGATIREYFPTSYISMLTSNVPDSQAIQLHNNHNIDLFVDKKDSDAIHNLYIYLRRHIESVHNQYALDPIEIFPDSTIIESNPYVLSKTEFLKAQGPTAFLILNEKGDIAISQDDQQVSFWQYNSRENNFIAYEYE